MAAGDKDSLATVGGEWFADFKAMSMIEVE
jgi:hypothetical protein